MVEAGASEQRAVDQAALAHESMVNSDRLLVQAKDRLLLLESRLESESGQVVQNAASRDRWKKSYEVLARERAAEQPQLRSTPPISSRLKIASSKPRISSTFSRGIALTLSRG